MNHFTFLTFFFLFSFQLSFSQDEDQTNHKFKFYLGAQTRVTPIEVKKIPDYVTVPDRNVQEQPHMHLSGPAFIYGISREISPDLEMMFSQAVRYDYLYRTLPFSNQPFPGFKQITYRALITELYVDMYHKWSSERSEIRFGLGVGIFGLGTNYLLSQRFVDNNNQSFYITSKENFVFPAVSATFGWRKNKLLAELKMGYCWKDPTIFNTPFLFPEIKLHYNIFSF